MQKLLDQIEALGFHDWSGGLLTDSPEWVALRKKCREALAYAVQADTALKLLEQRARGAEI